jgi:hypothetical protein
MDLAGLSGQSARRGAWSDAARAVVMGLAAAALWIAVSAYPSATTSYVVEGSPSAEALSVQRQAFPERSDVWILAAIVDPEGGVKEADTLSVAIQQFGVALAGVPGVSSVDTPRASVSNDDAWRTQSSADGTVRWFRVWFEPETRVTDDVLDDINGLAQPIRDLGASVALGGPAVQSNNADLPILPLVGGTLVVLLSLAITCRRSLKDWTRSFALLFVPAFATAVAQLVAGWTGGFEWGPAAAAVAASALAATACRSAAANSLDERTLIPHALAFTAASSGAFVLNISSLSDALPSVMAGIAVAWVCCTALPRSTAVDEGLVPFDDVRPPLVLRLRRGLLPATAIGCAAVVALLVLPSSWSPRAEPQGEFWRGDAKLVANAMAEVAPNSQSAIEMLVVDSELLELDELRKIAASLESSDEINHLSAAERSPLGTVAVVEALPSDTSNLELIATLRSGELTRDLATLTDGGMARRADAIERLDDSLAGLVVIAVASWAGAVFAAALLRRIDRRRAIDFDLMVDEELRLMLEGEPVAAPLEPRTPNPRDFGWRGRVMDESGEELTDQAGDQGPDAT